MPVILVTLPVSYTRCVYYTNMAYLTGRGVCIKRTRTRRSRAFSGGYYHVMTQDHFQFAHYRSRDLAKWERLPIALPRPAWDGALSMLPAAEGGPVILYDLPPEPSHLGMARLKNASVTQVPSTHPPIRACTHPIRMRKGDEYTPHQINHTHIRNHAIMRSCWSGSYLSGAPRSLSTAASTISVILAIVFQQHPERTSIYHTIGDRCCFR